MAKNFKGPLTAAAFEQQAQLVVGERSTVGACSIGDGMLFMLTPPSGGARVPAYGRVFQFDADGAHNVVVAAYRMEGLGVVSTVLCGDDWLNGDGAALTAEETTHIGPALSIAVGASFGSLAARKDASCEYRQSAVGCCRHTEAVMQLFGKTKLLQEKFWDEANGALTGAPEAVLPPETAVSRVTARAFSGVNFLLKGARGAGKTHFAQELAEAKGAHLVDVGCFDGMEARDFIGGYFPNGEGSFSWLDAGVAEAFRAATRGPVVLLLDELLRAPQRQLSVLLTALSPFKGKYRLRTDRVVGGADGVGVREVIECPQENLLVIATTNVGADYQVDELDPAIEERFIPLSTSMSDAELQAILISIGASNDEAARLVQFHSVMGKLKQGGLLRQTTSTRSLVRAVSQSLIHGKSLRSELLLQVELWVDFDQDGVPIAEQIKLVEEALTKVGFV